MIGVTLDRLVLFPEDDQRLFGIPVTVRRIHEFPPGIDLTPVEDSGVDSGRKDFGVKS